MEAKEIGSLRILIIEDNQDLAALLCSLLELMGHSAVAANTGSAGLTIAKEDKSDVIFCDIGLPDMNGYEVANNMRNDEEMKDACLIALTGYASANDMDNAVKAGFNFHLAKPISTSAMKDILEKVKR
jgi:CheY-like chemotaxis protein